MPQKVSTYIKAFRKKKNETDEQAQKRMENRIKQLLKEGKLKRD
jgi:hypothetical protein